jgi:hypothetical protein
MSMSEETLKRALEIHKTLTRLVVDRGDLQQLAEKLAGLISQSISIETERFEALAAHNVAPVDEARRYTQQEGRTNPRLIEALEQRGIMKQIRSTLAPVHLPQIREVGLEMERILAPVVVQGGIYGYLWIIADDRPLEPIDWMAIESGAMVAALIRLHQEAVAETEARLKGGLLANLIEGKSDRPDALFDEALHYGVSLAEPFVVLSVDRSRSMAHAITLHSKIARTASSGRMVIGQYLGEVVALAQRSEALPAQLRAIQAIDPDLRIGVSSVSVGLESVGRAWQQSRDALHIAAKVGIAARIVYMDGLGYLYTLYQAGEAALEQNSFVSLLRALQAEQGADLFHTLEVYLDTGGNGVQAAHELSVHRSTLNYRLQRISEITGIELSDPAARTNMQIALKLLLLFGQR